MKKVVSWSKNENLLLTYDTPAEIQAFSTTRGHVDDKDRPYESFNPNPFCGDTPSKVLEAHIRLSSAIGVAPSNLIIPHQVHGHEVLDVDESLMSLDAEERAIRLDGIDALITRLSGVCICVSTADCVPVLVYDTTKGVCAAIHAGWRGTVQDIVGATIRKMSETYHVSPSECKAIIGPSISLESFEVGDEVYDEFANTGFCMQKIAKRYPCKGDAETGKWHIDLWEANRLQLIEAGLTPDSVTLAGVCTYKEYGKFFSARRLTINSGRIVTGIVNKR